MLKHKKVFLNFMLLGLLIAGCNVAGNSSKNGNSSTPSVTPSSSSSVSSSSSLSSPSQISSTTSTEKIKPTRPHTHKFGEWEIIIEADLFNTGEKYHKCLGCELSETVKYYDLSEVRFKDKIYQYNGSERTLTIDGLLPKGITVKYTNNKLTEIGSIVSTAYFIDENQDIIEERSAVLTIIPKRGLPEIKVTTADGAQINSKETYTTASITVSNCEDKYALNEVLAGIRLRGNGTLGAEKKPYRIKFDKKQGMLGLNDDAKAKSWVLLAEFYDYSMMRNGLAFSIGDAIMNGRGYYSSDFTHVNVYINGIYNGVYVLAEQQQVNENRVDIYEPEATELGTNIGYLLELDHYATGEGDYFMVGEGSYEAFDINGNTGSLPARAYSIKSDYYSPEQKVFISSYINNVYSIMYNAVVKGKFYTLDENYNLVNSNYTTVYETLNAVIDVDSLIRSYILEEFMKDIDVGFSSYYMFVDFSETSKFKKLTFGAPWDFDWSSGNVTGAHLYQTTGDYNTNFMGYMNPWLFMLTLTDFFYEKVHNYWTIMDECNVINKIIDEINYVTDVYVDDFGINFQKWKVLGTGQHTYHSIDAHNVKTHRDAVDCLIKWVQGRKSYLDSKWL